MDAVFNHAGVVAGVSLLSAVALRTWRSLSRWKSNRSEARTAWQQSLTAFERQLQQRRAEKIEPHASAAWKGYRRFIVDRKISEADQICSFYLTPEDGRELPSYEPGQYLTVRLAPAGQTTPLVRCYSLSDRPRSEYYRLTVKAVGQASNYLHEHIQPGDVIQAQAPRGDYHLQRNDPRPVILIAAGIGITPAFSMLSTLLHEPNGPPVVLLYGVRNSREQAFQSALQQLAQQQERFHYVPCYSQPLATDRPGHEYVTAQRIQLPLIQQVVQNPALPFYLCGPGGFMESLVAGLQQWGVAARDIHFEAFGPSTVKRMHESDANPAAATSTTRVIYKRSNKTLLWKPGSASLLEQAESQELNLPSGCRSGNCGMCAVKLLAGEVQYQHKPSCDIPAGSCLTCVAQPRSEDVILDA
jgi:ferredoxin-NADP reductase